MNMSTRYSPEVRERAVWLVLEHQGERGAVEGDPVDCGEDRVFCGRAAIN